MDGAARPTSDHQGEVASTRKNQAPVSRTAREHVRQRIHAAARSGRSGRCGKTRGRTVMASPHTESYTPGRGGHADERPAARRLAARGGQRGRVRALPGAHLLRAVGGPAARLRGSPVRRARARRRVRDGQRRASGRRAGRSERHGRRPRPQRRHARRRTTRVRARRARPSSGARATPPACPFRKARSTS